MASSFLRHCMARSILPVHCRRPLVSRRSASPSLFCCPSLKLQATKSFATLSAIDRKYSSVVLFFFFFFWFFAFILVATQGLSEEDAQFVRVAQDFSSRELVPNAAKWDQEEIFPVETLRQLAELGFGGLTLSFCCAVSPFCFRYPSIFVHYFLNLLSLYTCNWCSQVDRALLSN